MNIQRYIKKLHTVVISGRHVQNLPQCNNDAAMFLQRGFGWKQSSQNSHKVWALSQNNFNSFFLKFSTKINVTLGVNKIIVCIFGDSLGYLIPISEIQTERKYGGTVTYQGDIHQIETSVLQRGILYRGAVHEAIQEDTLEILKCLK